MRILHVSGQRGWGGGEQQVTHLTRCLKERGHEVALTANPGSILDRVVGEQGVDLFPVPLRNEMSPSSILGLGRVIDRFGHGGLPDQPSAE